MKVFVVSICALLLSSSAKAVECYWAAPDNTGRSWAHHETCHVSTRSYSIEEAPALGTEIIVGARDTFWSVTGSVGRHIIPGYVWTKDAGWVRDTSRDQVLWTGGVKPTSASCRADGGGIKGGYEFSNGMRICLPGGR